MQYLISSIVNSVYEVPHEFLNDVRRRKLGNKKEISKLSADTD